MAQGKSKKAPAGSDKRNGKIAEIEKKGKTATLTIEEADGEKFPVHVTSRVKMMITGKGDAAFLKHPRTFVSSEKIFTANGQFFGKKFTVHLGNPPESRFEPEPDNPEVYHVAGSIVECDDAWLSLDVGGAVERVNFEQGAVVDVTVESTDPDHAAVGSEVEVEGITKGGKFTPTAVAVNLEKPLVADEVFSGHDKKGSKSKAAAKTAKKPAKGDKPDKDEKGDDEASSDPLKPSTPFSDLDKKDSKPSKKKATSGKPKAKKPVDEGEANN